MKRSINRNICIYLNNAHINLNTYILRTINMAISDYIFIIYHAIIKKKQNKKQNILYVVDYDRWHCFSEWKQEVMEYWQFNEREKKVRVKKMCAPNAPKWKQNTINCWIKRNKIKRREVTMFVSDKMESMN